MEATKSVKIVYGTEPRRVSSTYFDFTNFRQFTSQLRSLFQREFNGMEYGNNFVLKYMDDEGDHITVKSDEELITSIRSQNGGALLKYQIVEENTVPPVLPQAEERREHAHPATHARDINTSALQMLSVGNLEGARVLLQQGLNMFPRNVTLYYNLGCVESLAGDLQAAFECLRSALMFGYRDLQHIMTDPDLENLRNCAVYNVRTLLEQLELPVPESKKPETTEQELPRAQRTEVPYEETVERNPAEEVEEIASDSSSEAEEIQREEEHTPAPQNPAPVQPVQPVVSCQTPVDTLESARFPYNTELGKLEDMGFQTGKAMRALIDAKGNLAAALEAMF